MILVDVTSINFDFSQEYWRKSTVGIQIYIRNSYMNVVKYGPRKCIQLLSDHLKKIHQAFQYSPHSNYFNNMRRWH